MNNLLNIWVDGIVGEIIFFVTAAIIMSPFATADYVLLKKISSLKSEENGEK